MRRLFYYLLLSLLCAAAGMTQTLVLGYSEGNAAPYTLVSESRLTGGIIKDIGDALARELKIEVAYVLLPPAKINEWMKAGKIAVIPIWNPGWTNSPQDYVWSHPLFSESNIVVVNQTNPLSIGTLANLKGKRIGTILGYAYPELQPFFAAKEMLRDDVYSLDQNFKKLRSHRIDALVDSNILIDWYLKNSATAFFRPGLVVSRQDIQFGISRQCPIDPARIIAALDKMKSSGQIERILANYR